MNYVPDKLQEDIDPDVRLQSINKENESYIVFHSSEEVEADLDTQGDTAIIKFHEERSHDDAVKPNVYDLTMDSDHDTIDVQVNGESIPFDKTTT